MKRALLTVVCLVVGASWAGFTLPASADTIFNNSVNDPKIRFNPGTLEVGDEIVLAGSARYLTNMSFEYWGTSTANPYGTNGGSFAGFVEARVCFYKNDGAPFNTYNTPFTCFYNSDWFGGFNPTDRSTFVFSAGYDFDSAGLYLPVSDFTWSVQFRNLGAGDNLGVDIYTPPVTGSDYPDYWENNGGWALRTNSVAPNMNFATLWQASEQPVPEPSALALLLVFGGISFAAAKRRQQK